MVVQGYAKTTVLGFDISRLKLCSYTRTILSLYRADGVDVAPEMERN